MLSSKMLKSFVKMHEYKLNAKINGLRANRLESQLDPQLHGSDDSNDARGSIGAYQHWDLEETDTTSRRRPKSHYFNFIMTNN